MQPALEIADDLVKELEDKGWTFDNSKVVDRNPVVPTKNRFEEDTDG